MLPHIERKERGEPGEVTQVLLLYPGSKEFTGLLVIVEHRPAHSASHREGFEVLKKDIEIHYLIDESLFELTIICECTWPTFEL